MKRAYVDRRVDDLDAASRAACRAARHWGLDQPRLLRQGMNAIFRIDDTVLRVATPNAPARVSIELASVLADRGIPVPHPVRDVVVEDDGYAVTAWEHIVDTGQPIDWGAVGEIVRSVHELPSDSLPDGLPRPSPTDFPWWDHDEMFNAIGSAIDAPAREGLRATIDAHRGWDDFVGSPGLVVCHGDVHPGNVMMTGSGPILLDWDLLCVAPRGWDHAPMMTWTERWGGSRGVYEAFAEGYGWSGRGDRYAEAFAELRLVSATLMRWKVAAVDSAARPEAERRLTYWRGVPDAPAWHAQ